MKALISSLYVHIPFCERKCGYCDFASVPGSDGEEEYLAAIRQELRFFAQRIDTNAIDLRTIFFGGGTPSFISPAHLQAILQEIFACFTVRLDCEITLEANPSSTNLVAATAWRRAGFNRVSLGMQSLYDDVLGFLGRIHNGTEALAAVETLRRAGFDNINCDLIYAVPGLDMQRWQNTLHAVVETPVTHISCYELTYEPQTPLSRALGAGRFRAADDGLTLQQHWTAVEVLRASGYSQYEVSAFAPAEMQCRHNLAYWRNDYYLAVGMGAHGHLPLAMARQCMQVTPAADTVAVRYWHSRNLNGYLRNSSAGESLISGCEGITAKQREIETILVGLRTAAGVVIENRRLLAEAQILQQLGMLQIREESDGVRITATERGQDVLNEVTARLAAVQEVAA